MPFISLLVWGLSAPASCGCSTQSNCQVDPGGIAITCVDAISQQPVCGALATFVNGSTSRARATVSVDGHGDETCTYYGPEDVGTYQVTFDAPGYASKTISVTLSVSSSYNCVNSGGKVDATLDPLADGGTFDAGDANVVDEQ